MAVQGPREDDRLPPSDVSACVKSLCDRLHKATAPEQSAPLTASNIAWKQPVPQAKSWGPSPILTSMRTKRSHPTGLNTPQGSGLSLSAYSPFSKGLAGSDDCEARVSSVPCRKTLSGGRFGLEALQRQSVTRLQSPSPNPSERALLSLALTTRGHSRPLSMPQPQLCPRRLMRHRSRVVQYS